MKLEAMRTELAKITTFGVNNGHPQIRLPFLQEIERHIDALVDGRAAKDQIETMLDRIALAVLPGMLARNAEFEYPAEDDAVIQGAYRLARMMMTIRPSI